MTALPNNKEDWLRRLQRTSLPGFSENIKKLTNTEQFVDSHSSELARTILKDPGLTAAVLKLANSAQFNTYGNNIRTVSRGVMLLGQKMIKEICTSCLLLDSFLKEGISETLKSLLVRSFHAAILAKEIANIRNDKDVEEIFISSLLLNIGEISVYASLTDSNKLALELMEGYPFSGGKEKDLIGCYFSELTASLCHSWGISPMIKKTLEGSYSETSTCRNILLANSLAASCENKGIQYAINVHIKSISRYCKKPTDELFDRLINASDTTNKALKGFGLRLTTSNEKVTQKMAEGTFGIVIDKANQLDALQELSTLAQEGFDLNIALQLLIEGLYRGAGFSCCIVALLNPQRSHLLAKFILEKDNKNHAKQNFDFNCALQIPEIQLKVMSDKSILLLQDMREKGKTRREITRDLHAPHSIWGPLVVENHVIGCLYADNGSSNQQVSTEQITAFKLFVYQAKINLHS